MESKYPGLSDLQTTVNTITQVNGRKNNNIYFKSSKTNVRPLISFTSKKVDRIIPILKFLLLLQLRKAVSKLCRRAAIK